MDTLALQQMIFSTPLRELPVTIDNWVDPATGKPANLIIRELNGAAGSALMEACTDQKTKTVNQDSLVAGIILSTLRNADDPYKALVFSADPVNQPNVYSPAFHDSLMASGLGNIMSVAQKSLKLSGLADDAAAQAKNA